MKTRIGKYAPVNLLAGQQSPTDQVVLRGQILVPDGQLQVNAVQRFHAHDLQFDLDDVLPLRVERTPDHLRLD